MPVRTFLRKWRVLLLGLSVALIAAVVYAAHIVYEHQLLVVEREGVKLCPYRSEIDRDLRQYTYVPGKSDEFYGDVLAFTLFEEGDPEAAKLKALDAFRYTHKRRLTVSIGLARSVAEEPPTYGPRQIFEGSGMFVGRKVEFDEKLGFYQAYESPTKWILTDRDPTSSSRLNWKELRDTIKFHCHWVNPQRVPRNQSSCSHTLRIGDVLAGYTIPEVAVPLYQEIDKMIVKRVEAFRESCSTF